MPNLYLKKLILKRLVTAGFDKLLNNDDGYGGKKPSAGKRTSVLGILAGAVFSLGVYSGNISENSEKCLNEITQEIIEKTIEL